MLRPKTGPLPHTSHLADTGFSPLLTAMRAYCISYRRSPSIQLGPATAVLRTWPPTARGPRWRGGQSAPTAVGRPPGATVGRSRPRGARAPSGTAVPVVCHATAVAGVVFTGVARTLLVARHRHALRP